MTKPTRERADLPDRINLLNMDAQDNQDPTLLHERLAPAMTASGFVDV